ncbi:rhodanese-like domain-containing protein [Candidatus Poribacteria bacterium]|nr:rhodanese-like domain-containing protein [Candidatus Poribacteria bacterium]
MQEPLRVPPSEARGKVKSGDALLVCAYSDAEMFKSMHLEGAISLQEFESKVAALPKTQEIVFYCA